MRRAWRCLPGSLPCPPGSESVWCLIFGWFVQSVMPGCAWRSPVLPLPPVPAEPSLCRPLSQLSIPPGPSFRAPSLPPAARRLLCSLLLSQMLFPVCSRPLLGNELPSRAQLRAPTPSFPQSLISSLSSLRSLTSKPPSHSRSLQQHLCLRTRAVTAALKPNDTR